jgi:transposase
METLVARCAGLDVHKDSVTACVRVPDGHGGRQTETRRFTTTTAGLVLLAQWLGSFGVTRVGMESTGCYWKPIWQLLEDQVECWLLNATHLHHVPGRKTDVADAAWIAQLVEHGLVRPSFVPPRPIRELRELTRYRKTQIQERGREVQRLDKVLQEVDVETWDPIRSRRNVRSYGEGAIAPEDLDRILKAARRAPSAGNQQAWDFVVCTDREQLTQLAKVWQAAGHVAGSAATIALVAPSSDDAQMRDLIQFDLGQATMSIMLAAADLGIGSAHAGVHDQELARRLLGVPEDRFCPLADHLRHPCRPSAHANPAAQPAPLRGRRASRPLVAAAPTRGRCRLDGI